MSNTVQQHECELCCDEHKICTKIVEHYNWVKSCEKCLHPIESHINVDYDPDTYKCDCGCFVTIHVYLDGIVIDNKEVIE